MSGENSSNNNDNGIIAGCPFTISIVAVPFAKRISKKSYVRILQDTITSRGGSVAGGSTAIVRLYLRDNKNSPILFSTKNHTAHLHELSSLLKVTLVELDHVQVRPISDVAGQVR